MKEIKPFIKLVPLLMLGACFALTFIARCTWYEQAYPFLSQIMGASIVTNLYFAYFIFRFKMCGYTKASIAGLLCLNIFDIINLIHPMREFYVIYNTIITYFFFIISLLFYVLKKDGTQSPG